MRGVGLREDVRVEILAAELAAEVVAQVVLDEVLPRGREAVAAVQAAESVVDRGVDRAGRHERAELGNGARQLHLARRLGGGLQILRLERMIHVERMRVFGESLGDPLDFAGQRLHGRESRVVRDVRGGERPHVPERHRGETFRRLAALRPQAAVHIQQRDPIHLLAAELVWRAVEVIFETGAQFLDAGVGRGRRGEERGHGQKLATRDAHNPAFSRYPRKRRRGPASSRHTPPAAFSSGIGYS